MRSGHQPKRTSTLFENRFLEKLTRTHISVPVSLFVLYAISLFYWSMNSSGFEWPTTTALFISGLLFFTWSEYQIHRRIFHLDARTAREKKIQHTIHGVHHEFPKDKDRLAMPPVLSVTVATGLLVIFYVVIGNFAFGFLSGFFTGYAGYLLVHYIIHVYAPPRNIMRILWINHAVHHYRDSSKAFGVSSPLWDYIYKTNP